MKKNVIFLVVVTIVLWFLFIISIPIVNDYTVKRVLDDLEALPLPPKTEFVESISKTGKLYGNGNGMQYFGAILVKSDLSLEEITEFYSKYRQKECKFLVKAQTTQEIDMIKNMDIAFATILDPDENYYIIYSWGKGIAPFSWLDLRGG